MQPICRSLLIYQQIPAGGGTAGSSINFLNQPKLTGCKVTGFRFFTASQLAFSPDRIAVLPFAEALNITLTLNESADERLQNMPVQSLVAEQENGVWRECDPFEVDWQSSTWTFSANCTELTELCFEVYYVRPEDAPELFPEIFDLVNGVYVDKRPK